MSEEREKVLTALKRLPDQRYADMIEPLYKEVWAVRDELEDLYKAMLGQKHKEISKPQVKKVKENLGYTETSI